MRRKSVPAGVWAALVLVIAGCGRGPTHFSATVEVTGVPEVATVATDAPESAAEATEMPDYHWSQLLGRDDIRPIYDPQFVSADEAGYDDDELVMGVAIEGEAKAYPVGLLNFREMVNDELAGIPILVTF